MARPKSEILSNIGIWFGIIKALADAVLRARGDDDVLRQVENPEVADEIAALLMARAGTPKPAPDITGLEVVELEVDGSAARWGKIEPKRYAYCDPNARTGDFPVKPGKRMVKVAIFPSNYFGHDPSNEEILAEIKRRNLSDPDRAVTETILDERKAELADSPIVGVCGVVRSGAGGGSVAGVVSGGSRGRDLDLLGLQDGWGRGVRIAAVVSE